MCGGGSFKKLVQAATLGTSSLADPLVEAVTPKMPDTPSLSGQQATGEAEVAKLKAEAAEKAKEEDLKRKRAIAKGGRKSTILAGDPAKQAEKKNLLGS
jgi:regulator of protease activity HflC (stomatin/prohibitin superfamily)